MQVKFIRIINERMNKNVLHIVLLHVDIKTIVNCSKCDRNFNRYNKDNSFWLKLCQRDYKDIYNDFKSTDYNKVYILCYIIDQLERVHKFSKSIIDNGKTINNGYMTHMILGYNGNYHMRIYNPTKLIMYMGNNLTIDKNIGYLENLKEISIMNNKLTGLPETFINLKKLELLKVNDGCITKMIPIAKILSHLTNLKELSIRNNKITLIPKQLMQLKNLVNLDFYNNKIIAIPKEIANLEMLKELCLDHNKIEIIPDEIIKLTNLELLSLGSNKIKIIPENLCGLKNLKSLALQENEIELIPNQINGLISLENLYLSNNLISELPKGIDDLYNLEGLYLVNNKLNTLPIELIKLKKIKEIWIYFNKVTIPDELKSMPIRN